jgi:hypothetical protein
VGYAGAGNGESSGDLAGDEVGVGGPTFFPFVLGYGSVGAQHVVECGEELGDRHGPSL